jgi:hypothetical protein
MSGSFFLKLLQVRSKNKNFLYYKNSFRWSLFLQQENQFVFTLRAFHCNLGYLKLQSL